MNWTTKAPLWAFVAIILITSVASRPKDTSKTDGKESQEDPVTPLQLPPNSRTPLSTTETNGSHPVNAVSELSNTQARQSPRPTSRTTPNARVDPTDVSETDLRPTDFPYRQPVMVPADIHFSRTPFTADMDPYTFYDHTFYPPPYLTPSYRPRFPPHYPSVPPYGYPAPYYGYWRPPMIGDPWMPPMPWDGVPPRGRRSPPRGPRSPRGPGGPGGPPPPYFS